MTQNRDDHSENNDEPAPAAADTPGTRQRHEPTFANFNPDEDDDYEEPDRDTDYASGIPSDDLEDDAYDYSDDDEEEEPYAEEDFEDDEPELATDDETESDTWAEKERFFVDEDEDTSRTWPLGLIAVAVVAIALLAAGGYGVVQQRTATENELRELRAKLATTVNTEESGASREALRKMKQSYEQLAQEVQALELENARLTDTVAGLEAQLDAQQAVLTDTSASASGSQQTAVATGEPTVSVTKAPAPEASKTASASTPQTAAPKPAGAGQSAKPSPAAANSAGPWFVNFGSYAGRTMAETWASRLKPAAGNVIISPSDINGKTLFRVRVIGLPDRAAAQQVARQLETEQRVSELWVGKD